MNVPYLLLRDSARMVWKDGSVSHIRVNRGNGPFASVWDELEIFLFLACHFEYNRPSFSCIANASAKTFWLVFLERNRGSVPGSLRRES